MFTRVLHVLRRLQKAVDGSLMKFHRRLPHLWIVFVMLFSVIAFWEVTRGADMLQRVFDESIAREQVVNIGNTTNAVGQEIFEGGTEMDTDVNLKGVCSKDDQFIELTADKRPARRKECEELGGNFGMIGATVNSQASRVVRSTKILLRFLIVFSVTMVIFNGVKYILAMSSADDAAKARKNLFAIGIGIVLALSSVSLIYLVQSLSVNTVDLSNPVFIEEVGPE